MKRLKNIYNKNFYQAIKSGSSDSAVLVAPLVMNLLKPASVIDVGCGTGEWLKEFARYGVDITGVDGDYVPRQYLKIQPEKFIAHDLSQPFTVKKKFDLALSLEVAEHLAAERAETFVDNLTALAPLILFSAAVPGQGGYGHINEQWPSYWSDLFAKRDYAAVDILRKLIWDNENIEWWYRQNLLIFADKLKIKNYPLLASNIEEAAGLIDLVHPKNYMLKQSNFKKIAKKIWKKFLLVW